jgi:hypothetical protein
MRKPLCPRLVRKLTIIANERRQCTRKNRKITAQIATGAGSFYIESGPTAAVALQQILLRPPLKLGLLGDMPLEHPIT